MDRNSIIGLVLIFVILISFAYLNQPSPEEVAAQKRMQDSITLVQQKYDSVNTVIATEQKAKIEVALIDTAALTNKYGGFAALTGGTEAFSTLENDEIKVVFTNKGGRIYSVQLKNHKRFDGSELVLFDGDKNQFAYEFATRDAKAINSADLYFTPTITQDGKSISMKVNIDAFKFIEHNYAFTENQNMLSFKLNMVGMNDIVAQNTNYIDLNWKVNIPQQEKTHEAEARTTSVYYRYADDEPDYLSETKDVKEDLKVPVQWISFKQQYFNSMLIADKNFESGVIETKADESKKYVKTLTANMSLPFNHNDKEEIGFKFYFGPNKYKQLQELNISAERLVPLGWGIFRWVNQYLTVNVFHWLGGYFASMGLIIFLLTLIVKTILFPLVYRSYLSAAKMRVLKPEIDEIKAKHGSDMAKIQQENMKIYRKAGVNPLGGCVPVLLQMPILIAMFQFFPSAFDLRQKAFLWANDLSTFDSILTLPFEIPFYGNHVSLFTILMTISTLIYTVYNNQMTGVSGQMKWMSYLMPIMFLGFFNNYAAGLTYYYFVSNLFTIGQQLAIKGVVNEQKLHAKIQEQKKKPVTKSRLQSKLEEMAKKRGFDPNKMGKK